MRAAQAGETLLRWTCQPGLEDLSVAEARALLVQAGLPPEDSGEKAFGLDGHAALLTTEPDRALAVLADMRSAYHLIRHIRRRSLREAAATPEADPGGVSAEDVAELVRGTPVPPLESGERSFRVSCNRSGSHAFHSPDIERAVGSIIVEQWNPPVDLEHYQVNLRIDIVGDSLLLGLQETRRPLDRRYPWAYRPRVTLRTVVAYAMLTIARRDLGETEEEAALPGPEPLTILDPFCGSGTIAVEAASLLPEATVIAADRDEEAVEGTRANAAATGREGRIRVLQADARDLDEHYPPASVSAIVTNPPFGIRLSRETDFRRLYGRFLSTAQVILRPGGIIVILVGKRRGLFNKLLRELGLYDLLEVRIIEIGGVYPGIFVLRTRGNGSEL